MFAKGKYSHPCTDGLSPCDLDEPANVRFAPMAVVAFRSNDLDIVRATRLLDAVLRINGRQRAPQADDIEFDELGPLLIDPPRPKRRKQRFGVLVELPVFSGMVVQHRVNDTARFTNIALTGA